MGKTFMERRINIIEGHKNISKAETQSTFLERWKDSFHISKLILKMNLQLKQNE